MCWRACSDSAHRSREATDPAARWRRDARFAARTALAAGAAIDVDAVAVLRRKRGPLDIVTAADRAAERIVLGAIRAHDPGAPILSEEHPRVDVRRAARFWVVDPLDGTLNFSRGVPFYCVAIACVEDGVVRAGAIHAPRTRETFLASERSGALLGRVPIRVSRTRRLDRAIVVSSLGPRSARRGSRFTTLNEACARVRVIGSAALEIAYVAAGRFDLMVHEALGPWDIAAAQIVAREAGAAVRSLRDGGDAAWDERQAIVGPPALVTAALDRMGVAGRVRR